MNKTILGVRFEGGTGESLRIDAVNGNGQRCRGTLGVPGTHQNAIVYKLECTICGFVYGANSGDVHDRICPNCQGGAPGIRYWLIARKVPIDANGGPQETRVEYDRVETAADWFERTSGVFKDVPEADYAEFLEHCRRAREEMNHPPEEPDEP